MTSTGTANADQPAQARKPLSCSFAIARVGLYYVVYSVFSRDEYSGSVVEFMFRVHSFSFAAELVGDYYLGLTHGQYVGGCLLGLTKWASLLLCIWMAFG